MHPTWRTTRWRLTAICAALATLLSLVALPAGASGATPGTGLAVDTVARIQPKLVKEFEASVDEPQDFWVTFDGVADTSSAADIPDWGERGQVVYDALQKAAETSQADVATQLNAAGASYTSYWITNAIHVEAGTYDLALELAAEPEVAGILAPVKYQGPDPVEEELAGDKMGVNADAAVEWGIANIEADQVWDTYGVRGDGVVIGSIDTGVQYDHPALVNSYRGYHSDGTISHDYNWFDASGSSPFPVDGHGHGTHTMGTMVGDDGAANRVGVAPGATWIAANGCMTCSDVDLIASAQWMLAPTKVDGTGADPAKRPNIINNSWGTQEPTNDPFMEDIQQAWADAGIFGVWANGNIGPGCNTSGSPGSRTLNYSVGNYDVNNVIAPTSSRGSGQDGEIKPNISAPGTNVRSTYPGNRYAYMSGTSMAAPHTAGAIALLYTADPSLIGDIDRTREFLDGSARDTADDQCGGTAADNNVYGEGRLDALAMVAATDQAGLGTTTGTITDAKSGAGVPGATVRLAAGSTIRSARTDESGAFTVEVPAGDYKASVTAFGFEEGTGTVTVTPGETATLDVGLTPVAGHTVTGHVVDQQTGNGIPEAVVTLAGSLYAGTTDRDGSFRIEGVPGPKDYLVSVNAGICGDRVISRSVRVGESDATVADIAVPRLRIDGEKRDGWGTRVGRPYGYTCVTEPSHWIGGDTPVELSQPESGPWIAMADLPFEFWFNGRAINEIKIRGTQGENGVSFCVNPPDGDDPCPYVASMFLDLGAMPRPGGQVLTRAAGVAPNRTFTIEWRDFGYRDGASNFDLALTLREDGDLVLAAHDIDTDLLLERMGVGEVMFLSGYSDPTMMAGGIRHYLNRPASLSNRWPWRSDTTQVRIDLPDAGRVSGVVTDGATGDPVAGATVDVFDPGGRLQWRFRTNDDGRYRAEIFTGGAYTVSALKPGGYGRSAARAVRVLRNQDRVRTDLVLYAPRPTVDLTETKGQQTAVVTNTASADNFRWEAALRVRGGTPSAAAGSLIGGFETGRAPQTAVEEHDGSLWIASVDLREGDNEIREFTPDGVATGVTIHLGPIADQLGLDRRQLTPFDLAFVDRTQELCVASRTSGGPFNDIVCFDTSTQEMTRVVETDIPDDHWTLSLAYDERDDLFFVQHWLPGPEGEVLGSQISTLEGVRHDEPGAVVGTCTMYGVVGVGLGFHPGSRMLWKLNANGVHPWFTQIDPRTCIEHRGSRIAGVPQGVGFVRSTDIGDDGTIYATGLLTDHIMEYASGDNLVSSLPWLRLTESSGTVAPGESARIGINVDEDRIPAGVESVDLVIRGNGGRRDTVRVPIRLRASQQTATSLEVSANPTTVRVGESTTVRVRVDTTSGVTPTGRVLLSAPGRKPMEARLADGIAKVRVAPFATAGGVRLTARYLGDAWNRASTGTASVTVRPKPGRTVKVVNHVVYVKHEVARVRLACVGAAGTCHGRAVITKRSAKLATGRYQLTAGERAPIRLPLTKRGLALLKAHHKAGAILRITLAGAETKKVQVVLRQ